MHTLPGGLGRGRKQHPGPCMGAGRRQTSADPEPGLCHRRGLRWRALGSSSLHPRASSAGPPRAPPGSVLLSSGEGGRWKAGPFGCLAYICLREEHQLSRVLFDSASGAAWCPSRLLRQPTVQQETSRSGRCPSPGSCGLVPAVPVGLCGMALRVRVTTEIPESPANRIVSALPSPGR